MIWIGTSGFQYPEWKGTFYPEKLSTKKMLPYYAERFPTTEVNYSFRRIPSAKTIASWNEATPDRFRFTFKAPQEITHIRRLKDCSGVLKAFIEAITPMDEKLGVILFQLPPSFRKDVSLLKDFLDTIPASLKCAIEFRHSSWFCDEAFAALKSSNAALCVAETEDLSTPTIFTASFRYFRLRRLDYSDAQIDHWAEIIRQHSNKTDTFVYFKHEEAGVGPRFGQMLQKRLGLFSEPPASDSLLRLE